MKGKKKKQSQREVPMSLTVESPNTPPGWIKIESCHVDAMMPADKLQTLIGLFRLFLNRDMAKDEVEFVLAASCSSFDFRDVLAFMKVSLAARIMRDPDYVARAEKFQMDWNTPAESSTK